MPKRQLEQIKKKGYFARLQSYNVLTQGKKKFIHAHHYSNVFFCGPSYLFLLTSISFELLIYIKTFFLYTVESIVKRHCFASAQTKFIT